MVRRENKKLREDEIDPNMPLYLGIDAGGTKTDCAVSNGAELLGQASGASCKLARVDKVKARENLHSVMQRACEAARAPATGVQHVCIGMAGASLPEAVNWAQETIREITPDATIYVAGDHVIAHRAAFGTSPGVLVISGTGSIAFGRNQAGETARVGGWGPNVSDEGSAFWVGREAVTAALSAYDLGSSNGLLPAIAQCWQVAPEDSQALLPRRRRRAIPPRAQSPAAPVKRWPHWVARSSTGSGPTVAWCPWRWPEACFKARGWCARRSKKP